MREHKYRAWDKYERRFWYFTLQGILERRMVYRGSYDEKILSGDKSKYIGRDDEHKTEMYEGDIIEVDDSGVGGLPSDMKFGYYKIVWEELECGFFLERLDGTGAIRFDECCKYTVLGNIYEHPELVQQLLNQTALSQ